MHHGAEAEYVDKNFGGLLIIWDRLFGTYEPEVEPPVYGVTHALASYNPIWANLAPEKSKVLIAASPLQLDV